MIAIRDEERKRERDRKGRIRRNVSMTSILEEDYGSRNVVNQGNDPEI